MNDLLSCGIYYYDIQVVFKVTQMQDQGDELRKNQMLSITQIYRRGD